MILRCIKNKTRWIEYNGFNNSGKLTIGKNYELDK
jgi:hypothetical protein